MLLCPLTAIISEWENLHLVKTVQPVTLMLWLVYFLERLHCLLTSDMKLAKGFLPRCCLEYQISGRDGWGFSSGFCHMNLLSGCRCSTYFLNDWNGHIGSSLFSGIIPDTILSASLWFLVNSSLILTTCHSSFFWLNFISKSSLSIFSMFSQPRLQK